MKTENYLSEELKKWMFFGNNASKILADLGSGKPRAGMIMDLNMKKVQEFINKFAPNALGELSKVGGGQAQMAMAFAGEEGLAGLWTGRMGVVMMGEVEEEGAFKPEFNFNIVLGKGALAFVKGMMTSMKGNMAKLELKGSNIVGSSSALYAKKGNYKDLTINTLHYLARFNEKYKDKFLSYIKKDMYTQYLEQYFRII